MPMSPQHVTGIREGAGRRLPPDLAGTFTESVALPAVVRPALRPESPRPGASPRTLWRGPVGHRSALAARASTSVPGPPPARALAPVATVHAGPAGLTPRPRDLADAPRPRPAPTFPSIAVDSPRPTRRGRRPPPARIAGGPVSTTFRAFPGRRLPDHASPVPANVDGRTAGSVPRRRRRDSPLRRPRLPSPDPFPVTAVVGPRTPAEVVLGNSFTGGGGRRPASNAVYPNRVVHQPSVEGSGPDVPFPRSGRTIERPDHKTRQRNLSRRSGTPFNTAVSTPRRPLHSRPRSLDPRHPTKIQPTPSGSRQLSNPSKSPARCSLASPAFTGVPDRPRTPPNRPPRPTDAARPPCAFFVRGPHAGWGRPSPRSSPAPPARPVPDPIRRADYNVSEVNRRRTAGQRRTFTRPTLARPRPALPPCTNNYRSPATRRSVAGHGGAGPSAPVFHQPPATGPVPVPLTSGRTTRFLRGSPWPPAPLGPARDRFTHRPRPTAPLTAAAPPVGRAPLISRRTAEFRRGNGPLAASVLSRRPPTRPSETSSPRTGNGWPRRLTATAAKRALGRGRNTQVPMFDHFGVVVFPACKRRA